jgi:hypothetical protein
MISSLKKTCWLLIIAGGSTSAGFAQSTFFEVASTPYDHQMKRVQSTLATRSTYGIYGPSLSAVNEWMGELRAMPYRYSREWRTPFEVEAGKVGDCKGKALVLYDWLHSNGAAHVRLVIGKRRAGDSLTHAWLEWQTKVGTLLLDPTFNWNAAFKLRDPRTYIAFYEYERGHKYQAGNSFLVNRSPATRAPAAPAHGVMAKPRRSMRSASRLRSSSWFDEGSVDPGFCWNRPAL